MTIDRHRMPSDYYWTLGLPRHAADSDVRKAYRKLAMRWHPKNFPEEDRLEAAAKFRAISEAYDVLSNKKRRMLYDKYGSQGFLDCTDVGIDIDLSRLADAQSTSTGNAATMKDARGCGTPCKQLRDPEELFYETFGCKEPRAVKNGFTPQEYKHGIDDENAYSGFLHDSHRFEHTFPGFPQPSRKVALESPRRTPGVQRVVTSYQGSVFSSPTDQGDYLTLAESDAMVNGRRVVTERRILNGHEIMTVKEDGVLVSKTVDGEPRDLSS